MRTTTMLVIAVASLCLTPVTFGQVALDEGAVQEILKQLTDQPRSTWIPAGTIEAMHVEHAGAKAANETTIGNAISSAILQYDQNASKREQTPELQKLAREAIPFNVRYRLANSYSMTARETVKYDGERFYWEINVASRQDSVKPDASLAGNYMTDEFNMAWNRDRIFAWDGQKYTTYSASGGQANVDTAGRLPRTVNGPLTAGMIPWGYGPFSWQSLSAAEVSARQVNPSLVEMTIVHADGALTELDLDPSKGYAVTAATLTSRSNFVATYRCSGYKSHGGWWVPSSITIDRQNVGIDARMPTSEQWTITSVSTAAPALGSFNVPLKLDALVEYAAPISASYVNSYEVDTDALLAERLTYAAGAGSQARNCATAAVQHVASAFGRTVSNAALANIVGPDGRTSLGDMKQLAQNLGLYCRAVKADLTALENLGTAKAILHIPGTNHFVVLDRVDSGYVWLIDLSSRKFYYRQSVHFFPADWSAGTALLVSNRPINAQLPNLPEASLTTIAGGAGWSCTNLLQEEDWVGCLFEGGVCQGAYTYWYERWGCEQAPFGTCVDSAYVRRQDIACVPDPIYDCTIAGPWYYSQIQACY